MPESPYADFARRSIVDWLPVVQAGFLADRAQPADAQQLATLTIAVIRGLLQDRNAVQDEARVDDAHALFVELLETGDRRSAR